MNVAFRLSPICLFVTWLALAMAILVSTYIGSEAGAESSGFRDVLVTDMPGCRYGVAAINDLDAAWVDDVGAGWYMNYAVGMPPASNGAEYVPLVWVQQDKDGEVYLPSYSTSPPITDEGLGTLIDQYPGALWIVGNEVDRAPAPGSSPQGDTYPQLYARAYYEIYHFIKARDPAAQVANSGLVEITPGRLQYAHLRCFP